MTPRCEDCNGACCRTLWVPQEIAAAWKDRDFIAVRSSRVVVDRGARRFYVLPSVCPALSKDRCVVYDHRPQT